MWDLVSILTAMAVALQPRSTEVGGERSLQSGEAAALDLSGIRLHTAIIMPSLYMRSKRFGS